MSRLPATANAFVDALTRSWRGSMNARISLQPFPAPMRIAMTIVGILCVLMGGVWFLQGINVLPGSFMTGQTKWAVYGGLLAVVGVALLLTTRRR